VKVFFFLFVSTFVDKSLTKSIFSDCARLSKEMVETMFIANSSNPRDLPIQNQVLDPRKAQNIATLLQLLNLSTKDVCQALLDGKIIFNVLPFVLFCFCNVIDLCSLSY